MNNETPASSNQTAAKVRDWSEANKWLSLAANFGVLLGLIVLIFEVRQNAALTRLGVEVNRAETAVMIELGMTQTDVADAWMVAVLAPETMTDAQLRMAETQMVTIMQQWGILFDLREAGLVSRERVERAIRNQSPNYFGSAFGKHWWALEEANWQDTPMYEVAGPIIAEIDPNFLADRYATLRRPFEVEPPSRDQEATDPGPDR